MRVRTCDSVRNERTQQAAGPVAERLEDRRLMSTAVYADFDGDGRVDAADYVTVRGDVDGADYLAVIRPGSGDGTFGRAQPVSLDGVPGRVQSLAAGDFNGDGRIDLLAAGTYGRGVNERGIIGVLIGLATAPSSVPTGTVTFAMPRVIQTTPAAVRGEPVVGDWNGDGRDDIAFANRQRGVLVALIIPVMAPPTSGEGAAPTPLVVQPVNLDLLGWSAGRVAAGDLNGDGLDDLAYIGGAERSLHILENRAVGRWDDVGVPYLRSISEIVVTKVTDNGTDDLVAIRNGNAHTFEGDPQRMLGLHVTTSPIDLRAHAAQHVVAADVDGDGHTDLFSPVPKNRPFVAFGDGTGAFVR